MTQLTREIIVRVINDKRSKNSILKNFRLLTSTARRKGRCKRTFVWTGTFRDNRLKEMLFLWCEINMHLSSSSWWENKIYIYLYRHCLATSFRYWRISSYPYWPIMAQQYQTTIQHCTCFTLVMFTSSGFRGPILVGSHGPIMIKSSWKKF